MADDLIPPTPTASDYEKEARTQEAFGAEDDQGDVFGDETDPIALFRAWLALAKEHEVNDANAMSVASVDDAGMPDLRVVLLKDVDEGFTFYTNMESAKGRQIQSNPPVALNFHWKSIRRQVRVRGIAEKLDDRTADDYFQRRDRGSRIGAWASQQSRPMSDPEILRTRVDDYEALFENKDVPRPKFWSGFRILPQTIEFWVNRPFRLHDRKKFHLESGRWRTERLYP